jgi:hypothetical protein
MHVDVLQLPQKNITVVNSRTQHPSRLLVTGPSITLSLFLFTQVILSRRRTHSSIARGHLLVTDFLLFSETRRRDSEKSIESSRVTDLLLRHTLALTQLLRFRSKFLSEMTANITVSWDVALCTLVDRYQGYHETHSTVFTEEAPSSK